MLVHFRDGVSRGAPARGWLNATQKMGDAHENWVTARILRLDFCAINGGSPLSEVRFP